MPFVSFENLIAGWDNGALDTAQYRQASSTNFLSSSWYGSQQFTSSQNSGGGYNACINLTYDPDQGYVAWENSVLANCTGFVHGVWLAYCGWNGTGNYPLNLSLSDGGQYWGYNQTTGAYKSGQVPKRGAIICFSQSGGYGHVGIVEKFEHTGSTYKIYIIQSAFADNSSTDSSRTFFGTYLTGTETSITEITWQNQWGDYVVQGFIYPPEDWFDNGILKGIDVSYWQGELTQSNWNSIRNGSNTAPTIDFAIIKATEGTTGTDPQFENNIVRAYNAGLSCGVFHYFWATTVSEAQAEANHFLSVTEPYRDKVSLWYALDIEEASVLALSEQDYYTVIIAFFNEVISSGLRPMLYGNQYSIEKLGSYLPSFIQTYPIWFANHWYDINANPPDIANWEEYTDGENNKPGDANHTTYCIHVNGQPWSGYKIWQFGAANSISVAGISGVVDVDFGYFASPTPPGPTPTYSDEIVFHKVLEDNLPSTAPNEKQHIYFTASSENPDSANLYISRKSDRSIIPVSGGGSSAGVSSIGGKTGAITLDRGLSIDDSKVLRGPDLSEYLTSADAQNTYAPKATNGYVEKQTTTSGSWRVYVYNKDGDNALLVMSGLDGTTAPTSTGNVATTTSGRLRTNTPTGPYHAANKQYVDDAIATAIGNAIGGSY